MSSEQPTNRPHGPGPAPAQPGWTPQDHSHQGHRVTGAPPAPPVPPVPSVTGTTPPGLGGQPRHVLTGAGAWWAGLTVLFLLPFVSSIAAGIVQWVVGRRQARNGELAAENGRRAANWGLTYLISTVVLVGTHFLLLWLLTRDGGRIEGLFPFGIIIGLWGLHTLVHIVASVWGGIVAGAGRVFRLDGIPFLRR